MSRRVGVAFAVALVSGALAGLPARASADELPPCRIGGTGGDPAATGHLGTLAHPSAMRPVGSPSSAPPAKPDAVEDAKAYLGSQFAMFWLQSRETAWYIGVAPGRISVDEARAHIVRYIDAYYAPDDATTLREGLRVIAEPYGQAELAGVRDRLSTEAKMQDWGVAFGVGIGCSLSDSWRVELTLFSDSPEDVVAEARELAAPYGDRVRVVRTDLGAPVATEIVAPPMHHATLRSLVRIRRQGHRVVVRVRRSARDRVERLTVRARGHRATRRGDRLTRPVRVRLRRRHATRVRVAVRLGDGTTVAKRERFRAPRRPGRR